MCCPFRAGQTCGLFVQTLGIGALLRPPLQDVLARLLADLPRLQTLRLLAPRAHRVTTAARLALATTHRVIDRVHRDAAVVRAPPLPTLAAGLADHHQVVVRVARLADR